LQTKEEKDQLEKLNQIKDLEKENLIKENEEKLKEKEDSIKQRVIFIYVILDK